MLYYLLFPLREIWFPFNVFRYITFRSGYAAITALFIMIIFTPKFIKYLKEKNLIPPHREYVPKKDNPVPSLGGIVILFAIILSTLLWADIKKPIVQIVLVVTIGMGLLGFIDDYRKIRYHKGIRPLNKLIGQLIIGGIFGLWLILKRPFGHVTTITNVFFFKEVVLNLGIFYAVFAIVVILATANATNFADGLDGLAVGLIIEVVFVYTVVAYVAGNIKTASYLGIIYTRGTGELTVFLSSIVGSALGFLWFNSYPAKIMMGDTGALALGGAVGASAVLTKHEILLLVVGGAFVIEVLSVIIQVISYKLFGKRVFRMTPLHHHFQLKGMNESQIVVRFWLFGIILAIIALSTLKLR